MSPGRSDLELASVYHLVSCDANECIALSDVFLKRPNRTALGGRWHLKSLPGKDSNDRFVRSIFSLFERRRLSYSLVHRGPRAKMWR